MSDVELSQPTEEYSKSERPAIGPYHHNENARFAELRDNLADWQWALFYLIVFMGGAISGYDVSNVATIQVSIYQAFERIDLLPWVVTAFSLGNSAASPLLDKIMKLMDLKWFSIGAWTLFLVATAITGASPTIVGVIVGRVLLGVAGGGCFLSLLNYITILARPIEHARLNSVLGMGFAIGLILGPIIGGAFAENEHATWRWAFYIGIPYTMLLVTLVGLVCPKVRLQPQEPISQSLRNIDWVGAFLHAATLVLFDSACISSGSTLSWRFHAVPLWVCFGLVVILYTLQQYFSLFVDPVKRILPIDVFSTRTGFLVTLCTFLACCGYGVALYYLPLYYAFTQGDDSLQTAVHLLPYICVYIVGVVGSGVVLPIVRRYAVLYLLSGILITAGAASMMSVGPSTFLGQTMGLSAILGLGVGMTVQLGASVLALALPNKNRMDSSVVTTLSAYTGVTVSLAVAGCLFQNLGFEFLSNALAGTNLSSQDIHNALDGVDSRIWAALDGETLEAAISAIILAIIRIFYLPMVGGVLMGLCALAMKWEALAFRKTDVEDTA